VISLQTARELWPGDEPLGKRLIVSSTSIFEVVGVVADAPSDMAARAEALMVYRSWAPSAQRYQAFARITGDPAAASHAIASAITDRFPGAVAAPETIEASLDRIGDAFHRVGLAVGAIALIAATLALVGVYGSVLLSAKRRTKEMGIRMALGARDVDVYIAMLRSNAPPVFAGLGAGLIVAVGLTVIIDKLIEGELPIRLSDPFAFWSVPLALAVVVLLAIVLPARRATGSSPVQALRQD
jgi:ABC-type antimicrobial peptide transport system permease subunit